MKSLSQSNKRSFLDNRYQVLAESSIHTYDDENLTSYAEFLRYFKFDFWSPVVSSTQHFFY